MMTEDVEKLVEQLLEVAPRLRDDRAHFHGRGTYNPPSNLLHHAAGLADEAASTITSLQAELAKRDEALAWYGERATTLAAKLNGLGVGDAIGNGSTAIEAILTELALDAGKRSRQP